MSALSNQTAQNAVHSIKRWNRSARSALRERLLLVRPPNATRRLDPSTRLFARIRRHLTLQYAAVLAATLILSGALLYAGMQHQLLDPVASRLQQEAQQETQEWQQFGALPQQCQGPQGHEPLPYLVSCYDTHGALLAANQLASAYPSFIAPSLAQTALANPSQPNMDMVSEQVRVGPETLTETFQRYTIVVFDPTDHRVLGVLQVGLDITGEAQALQTLLRLILEVGALTLLGCGIGGALLAARALAPARLSFTRQQQFIADASHELRTPITILRANAEVLLRGRSRLDPDDAPLLDDIVTETEHMGALAENLLTLARLDAGSSHLEQEIVDISAVAEDVARRVRPLVEEQRIQLAVEPAPALLVLGDSARLSEVALILVDNAIKYNRPGGSVTIRTYRDGQQAIFEVRDTGVGIAPAHLQHLGERFYRVDKARSRQMGGAGLGIAIARGIAAAHHGALTLASVPNKGTTATLALPILDVEAADKSIV